MPEQITEVTTPEMVGQHYSLSPGSEQGSSATGLPDLLLVEKARNKEAGAFETLMRRYCQRLYRITRSIVTDARAADAVVEEAYANAYSEIERYEPTGKLGAWLARLAFTQALAQPREARSSAATQAAARPDASQAHDGTDSPASVQALEDAIDALPEVFRTVFVLRLIEGISGIETAACLGIHETTVRTRLYRAQRRLRADLARYQPAERAEVYTLTADRASQIVAHVMSRLHGGADTR